MVLEGRAVDQHWEAVTGGAVLGVVPPKVLDRARWVVALSERIASRPARFGCSGLHEWAMVYRQDPAQVRHSQLPLRLGAHGTAAVVEELPLQCSHFDAFRFFTPEAVPRNSAPLDRDGRLDDEQGGCLHANMDLYSHAAALWPWACSDLVADCFELARRVRVLDMRASPYDVTGLGLTTVAIETVEGRREYADEQRAFAVEAAVLRDRLIGAARGLLD